MAIAFRYAVETDFADSSAWPVVIPNTAEVGDYLLIVLASPAPGILWVAPRWEQLDGFSTVQFSSGGGGQSPPFVPISCAVFGKFLEPNDDLTGTSFPTFHIIGTPTAVIGAQAGHASGVALCAAYTGVNRAEPTRSRATALTPPFIFTYNPIQTITEGPFLPVTSAPVPAVFGDSGDFMVAPLINVGSAVNVGLPGVSFIYRASTSGGDNIVITLADQLLNVDGLQNGYVWTADVLPTPLITEAICLWPDASYLSSEVVLYATLDSRPARVGDEGHHTVIANTAGYLFKVYAGPKESPPSVFHSPTMIGANLLLTRPDGSTLSQALDFSPDGYFGYCASLATWFPYQGIYYLQLQIQWANGSVEYSSQCYLSARPQGTM